MKQKISRFFILQNITIFILLFLITTFTSGCSGCSPSSRRNKQKPTTYKSAITNSSREMSSKSNDSQRNTDINRPVLPLNELYNKYKNSVFLVYTSNGTDGFQGSGFFISKSGIAVSNYHVFEGTSQGLEIIETIDGEQFKITKVLEKSKDNDYIIFKVNLHGYNIENPIPLVSRSPQIGEDVFAIGNPRGLESTLSKGIISALRENNTLLQTTTEITHGSSGGPLLNMKGEVIGITTAGLGEANLNFAININVLNLSKYL